MIPGGEQQMGQPRGGVGPGEDPATGLGQPLIGLVRPLTPGPQAEEPPAEGLGRADPWQGPSQVGDGPLDDRRVTVHAGQGQQSQASRRGLRPELVAEHDLVPEVPAPGRDRAVVDQSEALADLRVFGEPRARRAKMLSAVGSTQEWVSGTQGQPAIEVS